MNIYQVKDGETCWNSEHQLTFLIDTPQHTSQIVFSELRLNRHYILTSYLTSINTIYMEDK